MQLLVAQLATSLDTVSQRRLLASADRRELGGPAVSPDTAEWR